MTKITFEPNYFTYDQWIALHPDIEKEIEDCPDCNGIGISMCPCCDNETECGECDGTGEVETAREKYRKQLAKDRKLIEKYQCRNQGQGIGRKL